MRNKGSPGVLSVMAKDDPPEDADLKAAAEAYLTAHGMSMEAIAALRANLK